MSATTEPNRLRGEARPATTEYRGADRVGIILVAIAGAISIILCILTLSTALRWRNQEFLGVLVTRTLVVDSTLPVDQSLWRGLEAGMITNDRILNINGIAFDNVTTPAWALYQDFLASLTPGQVVRVSFERLTSTGALMRINNIERCGAPRNGAAICTTEFTVGRFPDADFLSLFIIPFATGILAIALACLLLLLRPRLLTARLGGGASLMIGVFAIGFFGLNTSHLFSNVWLLTCGVLVGTMTAFALVFPSEIQLLRQQPWLRLAPVVFGTLTGLGLIVLHENPPNPRDALLALNLGALLLFIAIGLLTYALLRRRRRATTVVTRDQINTVLIGCMVALALGVVWFINAILRGFLGVEGLPLNTQPTIPLLLVPVLSITYAVLRYRTFDSERMISQTITYTILLMALILGYFLLVLSASLFLREFVAPNNPLIIAITVFIMAVLFIPIRMRLQERIDKIYFRQRANYTAATENYGRRLSALGEIEPIIAELRQELITTLQPEHIYIFLRNPETGDYTAHDSDILFAQNSALLDLLRSDPQLIVLTPGEQWNRQVLAERARLFVLHALVIAGIYSSNRVLSSFLVLTAPRGGDAHYSLEALRYLENIIGQTGVAYDRAQVVNSLEQRVRELNTFSQISQGVNFTVDIDDLLELIYAQTVRLIDLTHFYITLYEDNLGELYHAFFIEDDNRHPENENRRWRIGNDLFSEVIRSTQTFCIADYTEALDQYGASSVVEDKKLRAWMGVPLIAGSRTIGVLSAGSIEPGKRFSDEQVKILTDIGLLAANSLDKARLFRETNERARQLAALNDITSQIVAAEKDVDRLLQVITESATDILGAEAGSLLLTSDDESGDLEFKVAVGGGGQNLIGTRVKAGVGLVGEVAATSRTVIVNDVGIDKRWGGEVAKEGVFHTNSVLAVPLITQNRVIGVLEVLNKKTTGGFSADDTRLLVAFAAQAAVAIENARLFQMTDLQLSQRVRELETMERMDVELNRSLDLRRIAELTVRSAMEISAATAGLLGVVVGDPKVLFIVFREGYGDDDHPMGAEGDRYPLELGIVSRVMRTRQPEVVPDVRIDPNYVPSLRGALSQITLPLISAGAVNAVLVLETNQQPRLRLADMPFLQRLAEHASVAIVNAQLYDEVERANQSKSEFVSFVAHELKNPLASIQGYSDLLIKGALGEVTAPQLNFLRTVHSNALRMNTIVSDLNDVTKLQTNNLRLTMGKVDFKDVVEDTVRPLQNMISDKGQQLVVDIAPDLPLLHADSTRLIQVLTNLVSNAHKYSPPDGQISIRAFVDDMLQDKRGQLVDPQVHITVTDQGIGMSKADVAKLFTPYFRSENPLAQEQPGTGLGLTITRGIIDGHGGMIWVESQLNIGTTFHFTCPMMGQE